MRGLGPGPLRRPSPCPRRACPALSSCSLPAAARPCRGCWGSCSGRAARAPGRARPRRRPSSGSATPRRCSARSRSSWRRRSSRSWWRPASTAPRTSGVRGRAGEGKPAGEDGGPPRSGVEPPVGAGWALGSPAVPALGLQPRAVAVPSFSTQAGVPVGAGLGAGWAGDILGSQGPGHGVRTCPEYHFLLAQAQPSALTALGTGGTVL